jgi:hypothetical protein
MTEVTLILSAIEQGEPHAAEQLLPLVYDELRQLAAQRLAQEKPGQTLQATALVHEAEAIKGDIILFTYLSTMSHYPSPACRLAAALPPPRFGRKKGARNEWHCARSQLALTPNGILS